MQKLKIHHLCLFLSQNSKTKIYPKLTNTTVLEIGKKILFYANYGIKLAILMLIYLRIFKLMVVDVQTVVLNLKEISFFFECPRYTQQRVQLFNQFNDISVPFHIKYNLYGSSDFSYNLNCKIFSYVHSYIIASKRF